jgi:hypothetical protein
VCVCVCVYVYVCVCVCVCVCGTHIGANLAARGADGNAMVEAVVVSRQVVKGHHIVAGTELVYVGSDLRLPSLAIKLKQDT